jgi:LuxR family quorum sensing-dependent transcriptional regulator
MDIDPVIRKTRNTLEPFAWSEAAYDRGKDPLAHKVMCEATEFRLKAGYTVPLFTRSGDQGGMTFGGERFEGSPDAKKALHLIAIYGHGKARAIAMARQRTVVATPKLSAREIEVLKWCAAGKTNSAIADILLVSETTIETHIVACMPQARLHEPHPRGRRSDACPSDLLIFFRLSWKSRIPPRTHLTKDFAAT